MTSLVAVGERFTSELRLDDDEIRRGSSVAGDENPLHYDVEFATSTRFGGLIASGAHTATIMMGMVATHFARTKRNSVGLDFSFRFVGPARSGTTITFVWEVIEVEPKSRGEIARLRGTAVDNAGATVAIASAAILISDVL